MKKKGFSNRLYWKISATLFTLLLVLGGLYIVITAYVGRQYLEEANQRLYGHIADSTVAVMTPLVQGKVDTQAVQDIMHSTMVINPSVEVYLLDTLGGIITYLAPNKKIKLDRVNLAPVHQFIRNRYGRTIKGEDPRNPEDKKVFSAAPIYHKGRLEGYLYIILASEEQAAVTTPLFGSYILRLGTRSFLVILAIALIVGMVVIWLLTRGLGQITDTVRRFKEGDHQARIELKDQGDLTPLAETFNSMADTIMANIRELQSVENLRRELIANVSHDLRTPLAIMQGYIETMMIKEKDLSAEDRRRYLRIMLDSSEKLSRLVAQLFEYAKLEAKQVQVQKEPFFLAELAQDILVKYRVLADKQDISLVLEAPAGLPLVFADVALVERVIQNLLDNALKFTPEGGEVTLCLKEDEKGVEVLISDTGPGIPESEQAFIFERYRRGEAGKNKPAGAGLGLAIVKKILEIHQSAIQLRSAPNQGATFWFRLPAYKAG
ncbi:MAG TPA: HAMP domain-containing sensor histidine kinase [Flavilitoribacter sp.]|nr:HAMP domain-containing sensor histidine kinase [Flavilitoribacter sp.]